MAVAGAAACCVNLPAAAAGVEPFAWPATLAPFGNGYPKPGDRCRRLGESPATSAFLDHTATLVGCPGPSDSESAQAIVHGEHGRVVGEAEGVTLISIPNEGNHADGTSPAAVPEHGYQSGVTGTLRCALRAEQRMRLCRFDLARHDDRTVAVVVHLPGGGTRAIFFGPDGTVVGVGRTAVDRPVRGNTSARKTGNVNLIFIGRERYEVRDEVIYGE
ncbi:hypothetical protein D1Y85_07935 [Paraburkholderia dinghuensis]|uniref:Uncharacterized protein n=1 Tax=Paraburkholderia dinghuensis TaxID=2305225 RepID=A0A3N6Q5B9_9BURK|nr:hypothetical protein D1Y85_07935 [Paraburkholderia dinghuensis]